MRGTVLDEVIAAVKLLMDSQLFSSGMAAAIGSHIRQRLGPNFSWQNFGDRVYLEHASLLDLEPLQELLTFLWTQLGLKMHLLDAYIKAQQLLRYPVSYLDLHASSCPCILLWHEISCLWLCHAFCYGMHVNSDFTKYSAKASTPTLNSLEVLIWHETWL